MQTTPSTPSQLKDRLRRRALQLGLDDLGFTTAAPLPHETYLKRWLDQGRAGQMSYLRRGERARPTFLLDGARTLLVAAVRYAKPSSHPTAIAAYAQRPDYHRVLREALELLAEDLRLLQGGTLTRVVVDTAPILEKEAAARAGVGWIGKNTMLVHASMGCYTLLGEILWTGELPADPEGVDRCGRCRRCLDACPTGALVAPYEMDARRCLSYMTIEQRGEIPEEFREPMEQRVFGCDDCIAVCPFGGSSLLQEGTLLPTETDLENPSLADLFRAVEHSFRRALGWTPVERTRKRGFLRSLLIATGNSRDAELLPWVEGYLEDEDPRIREHAAWAAERLRPE
jgi:epoxyqueuosine reductase